MDNPYEGEDVETRDCRECDEQFPVTDAPDSAEMLNHYAREHPDSDILHEQLDGLTVWNDCSGCNARFKSSVRVERDGGGFILPVYCPTCVDSDPTLGLYSTVVPAQVLIDRSQDLGDGKYVGRDPRTKTTARSRMKIIQKYPRHPGEDRLVEVVPDMPVKQKYSDPQRWRYVFAIREWDKPWLDGEGPHATLTHIYAPDEDADPAGPEGYDTVAVNGGTRVPEFIRDGLMNELEIKGFGRPPFIPERDGEPVEPSPGPRPERGESHE